MYKRKVQYYETDKMGFVHHSNYIRWFEEARSDFFDKAGAPYCETEKRGIFSPVVSVNCEYKKPAVYGEEFIVDAVLEEFGNVKFCFSYTVTNENGELKAIGKSEHCFLHKEGKVISLKKEWPAMFEHLKKYTENV